MLHPNVVILAGPNGAGKSTLSEALLAETLGIRHYVNADTLARGLSAFNSEEMTVKAGKIMLEHLHDLTEQRANFAFETTLASRTFAPWIAKLKTTGYQFHLFYVWVPSAEVSVVRVRRRVMMGGHGVPEETIRRRYQRSLENFFRLYQPLADGWEFYDNEKRELPRLIAIGNATMELVGDERLWTRIKAQVKA
jgi:predicted ABC-type ATPase